MSGQYRLELRDGKIHRVPVATVSEETASTAVSAPDSPTPDISTPAVAPESVPVQETLPVAQDHCPRAVPEHRLPAKVTVKDRPATPSPSAQEDLAARLENLFRQGGNRFNDELLRSAPVEQLSAAMQTLGWRGRASQLRESRCAMAARLAGADSRVIRRVLHAWHVAGMPDDLLADAGRHIAVTFLPGSRASRFVAQPALARLAADLGATTDELFACPSSSGTLSDLTSETASDLLEALGQAWADLDDVRVVALLRGHGDKENAWSLRVMSLWLDETTHQLVVGGSQCFPDGQARDHVRLVQGFGPGCRLFTRVGRSDRQAPWMASTAQAGLDLVYAIELAAAVRDGASQVLEWPRPWVGFAASESADNFQVERGDGLKRDTLRWVRTWLARGRPAQPSFLSHLRDHPGLSGVTTWEEVEQSLGLAEAGSLLEASWAESIVSHDGLSFLPLDYFLPGSPQCPLSPAHCRRVILSFGPRLMGREIPTGNGPVTDALQARTQVLSLPRSTPLRAALFGQHQCVRWDLRVRRELLS
jgi:hypothetical protein